MAERFVFAVDPGKNTGLCLIDWSGEEPKIVWSEELEVSPARKRINQTIYEYKDRGLDVVVEKFTITPQTGRNSQAPWSLKLIGWVEGLCEAYEIAEPVEQTPQRAKDFVPNERLKALGIWHRGGAGHAKDALRHAVLYMVEQGWRPEKLLVK